MASTAKYRIDLLNPPPGARSEKNINRKTVIAHAAAGLSGFSFEADPGGTVSGRISLVDGEITFHSASLDDVRILLVNFTKTAKLVMLGSEASTAPAEPDADGTDEDDDAAGL